MTDAWVPDLARAGVKHLAIAEALGSAIESGGLRAGERLPPQRELAARLGVDLTTITKAYDAIRHRGLIEARGRAGSFVRRPQVVEIGELARADAGMNMPPELPGNLLGRTIAESFSALLVSGSPLRLQYQPAGGALQDRAAGAALLTGMGLLSDPEQVLVTAGGQNALHAVLGTIFEAGDAIACARHIYPGFKALAAKFALELIALPDLTAGALREACERQPIKGLYCVPTNDNPTAATLTLEERRALAGVAAEYDLQIIEDDAYGPLADSALPPLASLTPHRSWHIASMSKIISPALRVAFLRAPGVAAALSLTADLHQTTIMPPPLNAALVGQWIADGTYERLVALMRKEASERQALARTVLTGVDFRSHPQGYHLWVRLTGDAAPRELAERMRATGLSAVPAERFAAGQDCDPAVRISLGGPLSPEQLAQGLRLLRGYIGPPALRD